MAFALEELATLALALAAPAPTADAPDPLQEDAATELTQLDPSTPLNVASLDSMASSLLLIEAFCASMRSPINRHISRSISGTGGVSSPEFGESAVRKLRAEEAAVPSDPVPKNEKKDWLFGSSAPTIAPRAQPPAGPVAPLLSAQQHRRRAAGDDLAPGPARVSIRFPAGGT